MFFDGFFMEAFSPAEPLQFLEQLSTSISEKFVYIKNIEEERIKLSMELQQL